MNKLEPQGHAAVRDLLRVVGPVVLLVGLGFMAVGMINFFSAFGGGGPPRLFWCMFVGGPLLWLGAVLCGIGYMGAMQRYTASESAPVTRDTINYLADGTKDAVRDVAQATAEGIRAGITGEVRVRYCPQCKAENEESAQFCKSCGVSLEAKKACAGCGGSNDLDARFCNQCGRSMA